MAYVVAVANLKGGSGKSCIAANVACELAIKSTVVLVDADAQGTTARYAASCLLPVKCEHLPLEDERSTDRWTSRVLAIEADYVVLDAPPHVGTATKAIVSVADLVVMPVTASPADLWATVPAVELVRAVRASRTDGGPACILVPSRVDVRTTAGREIEAALKKLGEPVGPTIHQRAAFVDSLMAGRWVGDYAPSSTAHADITALAKQIGQISHHGKKQKSKSRG